MSESTNMRPAAGGCAAQVLPLCALNSWMVILILGSLSRGKPEGLLANRWWDYAERYAITRDRPANARTIRNFSPRENEPVNARTESRKPRLASGAAAIVGERVAGVCGSSIRI